MRVLYLYLADVPRPPAKIEAIEITKTSIKFRWTPSNPKDTGRFPIKSYRLLIKYPNGTSIVRDYNLKSTGNLLEYTLFNLKEATSYQISVSAFNAIGQGEVKTTTFQTSFVKTSSKEAGKIIWIFAGKNFPYRKSINFPCQFDLF